MSDQPISMSRSGPPETIMPALEVHVAHELAQALASEPAQRRAAVGAVAAKYPTCLQAWAALGRNSTPGIEAYMAFRVGYHRGLDQLRANGWRGSGYVRWARESNRGFLRCLGGLAKQSRLIGEISEAVRCEQFLLQLDPSGEASK